MTFAAPTPIRMIVNLPDEVKARHARSSMRRMIANAAPWPFALKEAYLRDFPEDSLWEVYGSTELGVDTVLAPADQRRKPGSCGRPAPGVEIKLFDAEGAEITAPGVPGELYVRSSHNFETYYKAAATFDAGRRHDFLTVGDIAYRDEEGYYYICDRKNDMIISGGMNVYPAEIEAALERHPGIVMAAAFGIPSEQWGESVHAVVVPRTDALPPTAEDVIAFVRQYLAGYKVPRSVSFADDLPHTGSGKVLRRVLREPFWRGRPSRVS
jgi:fatty-acyl-CoA synthase/long-chain acyl-CoA synthetase